MIVIEAFGELIGRLLYAVPNRNNCGTLPRLPLLAAYGLAYGVHNIEIPYLPSICRNSWEN
jgi:hypothetical protein